MPGARQDIAATDLINPILNSPYDAPESHFEIGPNGPTGIVLTGRRPSESFIPVPASRKGRHGDQQVLDFDITGERREQNSLINDIRREVERWRANGWNGVTPYTRTLLSHWAARPPTRDDPVLFCQREAAETAIFLAEVAGRHGTADYRRRIEPQNLLHSDGLPRVGMKMATGTGKTVVMAMIIAWQTINKVITPNDARFAKRFLVVTPGITIRDRLGVLHPERDDNYYRERDLVPPDLWDALLQAQIDIVNYHTFLPRDSKEIQGVSSNTRKLLRGGKPEVADAFRETPDMVATRILRAFGTGKGELVVLNDNRWSIARTVGGLAKYLNRIRTLPQYREFKKEFLDTVGMLPVVGGPVARWAEQVKEAVANSLNPGHLFRELGWTYFGPENGHDVARLEVLFRDLQRVKGPVHLHVVTEKGRGYAKETKDAAHAIAAPAKPAKVAKPV